MNVTPFSQHHAAPQATTLPRPVAGALVAVGDGVTVGVREEGGVNVSVGETDAVGDGKGVLVGSGVTVSVGAVVTVGKNVAVGVKVAVSVGVTVGAAVGVIGAVTVTSTVIGSMIWRGEPSASKYEAVMMYSPLPVSCCEETGATNDRMIINNKATPPPKAVNLKACFFNYPPKNTSNAATIHIMKALIDSMQMISVTRLTLFTLPPKRKSRTTAQSTAVPLPRIHSSFLGCQSYHESLHRNGDTVSIIHYVSINRHAVV